jgi:hypothetical protein
VVFRVPNTFGLGVRGACMRVQSIPESKAAIPQSYEQSVRPLLLNG